MSLNQEPALHCASDTCVVLLEGNSPDMISGAKPLAVEVSTAAFAGSVKQVKFNILKPEGLAPIVHPRHSLAFKDNAPVRRLVQEPGIVREKNSGARRMVNDLFRCHIMKAMEIRI